MNTLTQQEIKNLPAPPQEWLDEMYPKYDMLPHEIWNKIYDIKYDLEQKEHNQNKCDFWEHSESEVNMNEDVRASFRFMTGKEYATKAKNQLKENYEFYLIPLIQDEDNKEALTKVCQKLQTQKRPRNETYVEFTRLMNIINGYDYICMESMLQYNQYYFDNTALKERIYKEMDAYWKKYKYLESLCWEPNSNGAGMHEIQIDRLVSC
tara:strand:+ start:103 stop:726 length:624 start_codon:yes stop_codon:yes gene_type:complete